MVIITIYDDIPLDNGDGVSLNPVYRSSDLVMSQHFLLSAAARSLNLASVARMSGEEARQTFAAIRWADNEGKPYCPKCGSVEVYAFASRPLWKCKAKTCAHQFTATSGTIFANRKMPTRDYLLAIAIFVNGAKGYSALQLSRDLNVQYKTAFVLSHKLREALGADMKTRTVSGEVEIDSGWFGGYVKPENRKEDRNDRRLIENRTGKRKAVIVMRERGGKTLAVVAKSERLALGQIYERVDPTSVVHVDESPSWDNIANKFYSYRINHSVQYSDRGACTNQAESYFSRLRRAEIGVHHKISGRYLGSYANEMAWREDTRRTANGVQFKLAVKAAMAHPVSDKWAGYWQRNLKKMEPAGNAD